MIKKYYINSKRDGYTFDRNAKKYFSYGYDIWLNRVRCQERGFYTRADAEAAVVALKRDAKNNRNGVKGRAPYLEDLFKKVLVSMTSSHDRARAKRVYEYLFQFISSRIRVSELKTIHLQ